MIERCGDFCVFPFDGPCWSDAEEREVRTEGDEGDVGEVFVKRRNNRPVTKDSDTNVERIVVEAKIDDSLEGIDTVGASKD